jgi:hypothetical protein
MKTHIFKHLFCNIHFSLYMFTNSTFQCHKYLREICKIGGGGAMMDEHRLRLDVQKREQEQCVRRLLNMEGYRCTPQIFPGVGGGGLTLRLYTI